MRSLGKIGVKAAAHFDKALDQALLDLCHLRVESHAHAKSLALLRSLPTQNGGFGVYRHSWVHGQKSSLQAEESVRDFLFRYYPELSDERLDPLWGNISLGESDPLGLIPPYDPSSDLPTNPTTSTTATTTTSTASAAASVSQDSSNTASSPTLFERSTIIYELASDGLIRQTETHSVHKAAWLRSSRFRGSGRWLMSAADHNQEPRFRFSDDEYRIALRWRFLASPFADLPATPNGHRCTACPHMIDPADPFHFMNCPATGLHATRHAVLLRIISEFIHKAKKEALIRTSPRYHDALTGEELNNKMADIEVAIPHRSSQFLDLCIASPASNTFTASQFLAHRTDLAAAKYWEGRKLREAAHTREAREGNLVPFILEATGRMGTKAVAYIHQITDYYPEYADKTMTPPSDRLQSKLSTAIMKFQAWFATRFHASIRLENNVDAVEDFLM